MSKWLPSLNALRAFEAVSRHLSYQSAAEELRVTPAAVKQLVSKLESSVGTPLVQRDGRGLKLTAHGSNGCDELSEAIALIRTSVSKFRKLNTETKLVVSAESSFATAWLVPRLEGFRTKHPDVTVLIDSNQSIAELTDGTIDVGIRYGVESHRDLLSHRLFEDQVFPACSPSLANGPPYLKHLDDLKEIPLIHWDISQLHWASETKRWFAWKNWLQHAESAVQSSKPGLYFSEYGQAVQAAIAGQGMLLASWPILKDTFESGLLVAPFEKRLTTDIGYELVTTFENSNRPEVRAFVDWMLETTSEEKTVSL